MKAKKILYFLLLFTSLFFLSSCQEFIDNIKIDELETKLEESENEREKLEAQIIELSLQIEELNSLEASITADKLQLEEEVSLLESENQTLTDQVKDYETQITLLKNQDSSAFTYEEEIAALEVSVADLNAQINVNEQEIVTLNNTITTLEARIVSIEAEKEALELEIINLNNANNTLTTENDNLNVQIEDMYTLFNEVSYQAMQANVMIKVNHTNRFGSGVASQGSGVIFYEDATKYYVLTNNHVIYDDPQYLYIEYVVSDYKGNEYTAKLHSTDPNYDLGIIYFSKGELDLNTLSFSEADPTIDTTVISLGQPLGQINTISFGEVLGYQKLTLSGSTAETSNVEFDVIKHSSPINSGSSGGVLINNELEIVGLNYAGAKSETSPSSVSYAIPLSKIHEYLTLYNFIMA